MFKRELDWSGLEDILYQVDMSRVDDLSLPRSDFASSGLAVWPDSGNDEARKGAKLALHLSP